MDVFESIVSSPNDHIITWDEGATFKRGAVVKKRNNKNDVRLVCYGYQEKQWDKHPSMRQIIVRVFDKNKKTIIEVPILTDDWDRPGDQVVELMLKRWVRRTISNI